MSTRDDVDTDTTIFTIAPPEAGERLDRYVARNLADLSRSYAQQLIGDGLITVNRRPARAGTTLRAGDVVEVVIPPPQPVAILPEDLPLDLVYEDDDLVVVNKAAGMVVHPAPGHSSGTLVNALLARYPDLTVGGEVRPGIVHRLDQGTSGLLVVARNDYAMRHLTAQQRARTMQKTYLAVVEGRMKEPEGVIDAPIARHPHDRLRMTVLPGGRDARTHYHVREELGDYSLLEVRLETGRTHQIRVHMQYRNRPILGDPLYGARRGRANFGLDRQFLHAFRLGFQHPRSDTWQTFEAPLPADLQHVLERLRSRRQAAGGGKQGHGEA